MKRIQQLRTSPLKLTLLSVMIWFLQSNVRADGNANALCNESLAAQLAHLLENIALPLLGWLRIPLASFAGILMGNGFVYGEFINLDQVLYYLWNISKSFANFAVAILILYQIIKSLLDKDFNGPATMKNILIMGGALILAHMSRFMVGAVVDIATIGTTAIGGLPGSYIASTSDGDMRERMIESMKIRPQHITVKQDTKLEGCTSPTVTIQTATPTSASQYSDEELLDMILPKNNSISGPLLYIGSSVLRVNEYFNQEGSSTQDKMFIYSIRIAIVLLFVIILVMLIMINIIRIGVIWFFVAFAPLLIILKASGIEYTKGPLEKFTISNILKAIFAPVVATGLMSIALIVIVMMQTVLHDNSSIRRDGLFIENTTDGSNIGVDEIFTTTIHGNILGDNTTTIVKNTFSNLLLIFFTLFILFGVMKALMKYLENGIGGKTINSIVNLGKGVLGSLPMIPLGSGATSRNAAKNLYDRKIGDRIRGNDRIFGRDQDEALQNKINKIVGLPATISFKDYNPIQLYSADLLRRKMIIGATEYNTFLDKYKPIKNHYTEKSALRQRPTLAGMSGINTGLESFLKTMAGRTTRINNKEIRLSDRDEKTTLNQFIINNFNTGDNRKFFENLYNNLGGNATYLNNNGSNFMDSEIFRDLYLQQSTQ